MAEAVIKGKVLLDTSEVTRNIDRLKNAIDKIKNVFVKTSIDTAGATASAEKLGESIKSEIEKGTKITKIDTSQAEAEAKRAGERIGNSLFSSLQSISTSAIGVAIGSMIANVVGSIKNLAVSTIEASANVEQLGISFEVLVGNADYANAILEKIREQASKTPYELKDLTEAAKTMLSFKIPAEQITENLSMLGDIAQGNAEKLSMLTLAFSQMSSTGRLMGQDLLQMINAGFNPLAELSEMTGKSMGELKKQMEEGAISAEMVREAFVHATSEGGTFYKMSERQSKTFAGVVSTLKDNLNALLLEISRGVFIRLKDQLTKLVEIVGKVSDAFKKGGLKEALSVIFPQRTAQIFYTILVAIKEAFSGIFSVVKFLMPVLLPLGGTIVTFLGIAKAITVVRTAFAGLNAIMSANPFLAIAVAITTAIALIYTYWDNIKAFFANLWNSLVEGGEWLIDKIKSIATILYSIINPVFGILSGGYGKMLDALDNLTGGWVSRLKDWFAKAITSIKEFISRAINAFKEWWMNVERSGGIIGKVFQAIREMLEAISGLAQWVFQKIIEGIKTAYEWIAKVVNSVIEALFGGEKKKIEVQAEAKTEVQLDTKKASGQWNEFVKQVQNRLAEASKSKTPVGEAQIEEWKKRANELVQIGEVQKKQAEDFIAFIEKRNKKLSESTSEIKEQNKDLKEQKKHYEELIERAKEKNREVRGEVLGMSLEMEKNRLNFSIESLNSKIEEVKQTGELSKNLSLVVSLLYQKLNLEIEYNKILEEQAVVQAKARYEKEIEELKKTNKEILSDEKLTAKQKEEIIATNNETIKQLEVNLNEELKTISEKFANERVKVEEKVVKEIERLGKEAKKETTKEIQARTKELEKEIKQYMDFSTKIGSIYEEIFESTKRASAEQENYNEQVEQLRRQYVEGAISEREFSKQMQKISESQMKLASDGKMYMDIWSKTFVESLSLAIYGSEQWEKEVSKAFSKITAQMTELSQSIENMSEQGVLNFQNLQEIVSQSFAIIGENAELLEKYFTITLSNTFAVLLVKGVPALEAFKQAFLISLIDLVEKTILTYIPMIQAMVSATIPFPLSLLVVATLISPILAGLELAKAKIRGAKEGFMKGVKEGKKGAGDTMLIWINPKEVILPESIVEKNKVALEMMFKGISLDRQFGKIPSINAVPSNVNVNINAKFEVEPFRLYSYDIWSRMKKIEYKKNIIVR